MSWNIPKTEDEWMECLSAYIDDELASDDKLALEEYLQTDGERMEQLRAYQRTSSMLQTWTVDAPDPHPDFINQVVRQSDKRISSLWGFIIPQLNWGQFSMGAVTGVCALLLVQYFTPSRQAVIDYDPVSAKSEKPVYNIYISQNQADSLLDEITAAGLKTQMKTQIRNSQWEDAADTYASLLAKYSKTKALQEIEETPVLSGFIKKYVNNRSI